MYHSYFATVANIGYRQWEGPLIRIFTLANDEGSQDLGSEWSGLQPFVLADVCALTGGGVLGVSLEVMQYS